MAARIAPDVDAGEEEQPDHVDEMPVPGGGLEAEMLFRPEMALQRADQADGQEDGADDDVGAVEAGRHEEGGAVDVAGKVERRRRIFEGLDGREQQPEKYRQRQSPDQALPVVVQ